MSWEFDHGFVGEKNGDDPALCWYAVRRMWRLAAELPVGEIPLTELEHVLDQKPHDTPTKRDLAEVTRRIWDADLSYPVIFAANGWLMDGSHRIMKSYALRLPTVRAVRFSPQPEPDYRATSEEMGRILYNLHQEAKAAQAEQEESA